MTVATRFHTRPGMLPGVVASATDYRIRGARAGVHRGLPSPWITFIVSVDGPVRVSGTVEKSEAIPDFADSSATSYDVMVSGLNPVAAMVEQPTHQQGVQLAVHPLAARALLGCRAGDLTGASAHGHEVMGRAADELHDRVAATGPAHDRLDVVQQWVGSRVDGSRHSDVRPEVAHAWRLIDAAKGTRRIEDVAREVMLSPRQLRTLVQHELGLTPKQLSRSFRFDTAVALLAQGVDSFAAVAAEAGYADQSHLTREFQRMAGCSPTRWLAEERRNIQDGGHRNRPD